MGYLVEQRKCLLEFGNLLFGELIGLERTTGSYSVASDGDPGASGKGVR